MSGRMFILSISRTSATATSGRAHFSHALMAALYVTTLGCGPLGLRYISRSRSTAASNCCPFSHAEMAAL